MPPDPKNNPALTKIDQAIAADADALLQGDFETIDAVLEGVFEEQAALVQMDDKSPAANPRAMSNRAHAPVPGRPAATIQPPTPQAVVEPPIAAAEQVATAQDIQSAVVAPQEQVDLAAAVLDESEIASPEEIEAEPLCAVSAEAQPVAAEFAPVESASLDASVIGQASSRKAVRTSEPIESQDTPRETGKRAAGGGGGGGGGASKLIAMTKRGLVSVLVLVNYPLRFVPSSQRAMIDWVALSLVGWVPVVWILVLTLGHQNAHVQASAEVHEAGSVLSTTPVEDKAMYEADPVDGHADENGH